jgi:hypothetical protein
VGVAIAFEAPDEWIKAIQSIVSGQATGNVELDQWVEALRTSCDDLQIRFEPNSRWMHISTLIKLDSSLGGIQQDRRREAPACSWIEVSSEEMGMAPQAESYEELGDVDYEKLLAFDDLAKLGKPRMGELMAEKTIKNEKENEKETRLKGDRVGQDGATQVKGKKDGDDSETRLKGAQESNEETTEKITGEEKKEKKGWRAIFGGGKEKSDGDEKEIRISSADEKAIAAKYESEISAMRLRIRELEALKSPTASGDEKVVVLKSDTSSKEDTPLLRIKGANPPPAAGREMNDLTGSGDASSAAGSGEEEDEEEETDEQGNPIIEYVKKLLGLGKKKEEKKEEPAPAPVVEEKKEDLPVAAEEKKEELIEVAEEIEKEVKNDGVEKALKKLEAETEGANPKAKRVYEGLMTEIVQEKGRLQELAKKVNLTARQKEHEFKTQLAAVQQQLRQSEEATKQRDSALNRAKEQIAHLQAVVEKAKEAAASGGDDATKAKMAHFQKQIAAQKEENRAIALKLDETKKKLMLAEMDTKKGVVSIAEHQSVTAKMERANRQSEEYKRTNQQLAEKLAKLEEKLKANQASGAGDDSKKRLEAATRQMAVQKKEQERLSARIAEMQREDMRMKAEVNRLTAELKRAKVGAKAAENAATAVQPGAKSTTAGGAPAKAVGANSSPQAANTTSAQPKAATPTATPNGSKKAG